MSEIQRRRELKSNHHRAVERASTTDGLPVSPSLGPVLDQARVPVRAALADRRVVIISGLAIAVGIGFGGLRVLFKVFLPNKVFDREKQVEILQLGISSKPINAKDFY